MIRPSIVGPPPTRGAPPAREPRPRFRGAWGLILLAAAVAALFNLAQSIFCKALISFGPTPSSTITCLAYARDCSALGGFPPPLDRPEARGNNPAAEGMPIRVVTFEPPPDCP